MIKEWINKSNKKYNVTRINKHSSQKAITLIALIITIIILLILAGVTISILIGNGGLLEKATQSGKIYSEQSAKEKLEIVLGDLQADKYVEDGYNKNEYIDNKLEKENMVVVDNIVIVDDWKFEIDRNVPKIVTGLGKGEQNDIIQIEAKSQIRDDYVNANLQVNITYEGTISQIKIKGEDMEIPTKVENLYELEKEITQNGIYTIYVKDEEGNYKIGKIEVTEITEDIDIWNRQDMEAFRDKVNSGRTFEGRTARVMDNIDLEGSEENQWLPIGTENVRFKGTFEGNYHKISNLYINSTDSSLGLFRIIEGATIEKLIFSNIYIHTNIGSYGGVVAARCINSHIYQIWTKSADIYSTTFVGGIVANSVNSTIEECINNGTIKTRSSKEEDWVAGGIIGGIDNSNLKNCYNTGDITAGADVGGICGFLRKGNVFNTYNIGNITAIACAGGIVGELGFGNTQGTVSNSYCGNFIKVVGARKGYIYGDKHSGSITNSKAVTQQELKNSYASILGDVWQNDVQNGDGMWKYNNGYPILKWQTEH